ncbi:MAG: vitamin K epoxide reductase family protein [Candidatus Paceibacterota bacterium]
MTNLNQLLKRPLRAVPIKLTIILLIVAVIGFADATYLTIEHYKGTIPPCSLVSGCELVLTSSYSVILGMPVSLSGMIFYFLVLVGVFAALESKKTWPLKWTLWLSVPAFLASLWFTYLQIFTIHSYCLYCLASALTSTIIFIMAVFILSRHSDSEPLLKYYPQ